MILRILITLLCGVAVLCPLETRAAEAKLTIRASIISYADWQRMNKDKAGIVSRRENTEDSYETSSAPASAPHERSAKNVKANDLNTLQRISSLRDNNKNPQEKFMAMDMNNDNVVTRREYLISTSTPVKDSDFDQLDLNGDGLLSHFEVNARFHSKNRVASN